MAKGKKGSFEFFCCAIPLINVGAYVTVVEIAIVAFLVGILALAPSYSIVAGLDVIPSWGRAIVSALGFVTSLWQVVGIVSIRRETTKLYHAYVRITTLLTVAILAATIAFLVVAATQHSTAQSACNANYGNLPASTSSGVTSSAIEQNLGNQICNYFIWVQVGAMGGLILLIGLTQLYMCFALRAYGVFQRRATREYQTLGKGALYDTAAPQESYPLAARDSTVAGNREDSPVWEESQEPYHAHQAYATPHPGTQRHSAYDGPEGVHDFSNGQSASGGGDVQPGYGAPLGYPTGGDYQSGGYQYDYRQSAAPGHYGAQVGDTTAPYETYPSR